jgi:spermidine synthase
VAGEVQVTAPWRLATYSALILFFELALIRYTAGYVHVFGFYLNFVLIATFLGMGVGLLRAEQAGLLKWIAVPAMLLLFGAIALFAANKIAVPVDPDEFLWGVRAGTGSRDIPLLVVAASIFALCSLFFLPLGALLGAEFRKLPPLRAYSWDIGGSLAGILAFGLMSANRQGPFMWFFVALGVWVIASIRDWRYAASLAASGAVMLALASWTGHTGSNEYWSPYYRINVAADPPAIRVDVNGSLHQFILNLDSVAAQKNDYERVARAGYLLPYNLLPRIDTALVVGAGTGNDLSLLLQRGAKYIDAVEIDPVIADLGAALHFQHPYSDPRVHLHVNDARAFLRTTARKYDVVIFGTLDSQTLLSGMSSVRLDNYVYTEESFASARARLTPGGTMIVYHMSGQTYIAAKIYGMLGEAFGAPPGVFFGRMNLFNVIFVEGGARSAVPPADTAVMRELRAPYTLSHDDWPYLYLRGRSIPGHYLAALLALLAISAAFIVIGGGEVMARGFDGAMFFMGAGFMLVETKSVTEMSLLFGSTWTVNLLVFSSILVMVLAANLWVMRHPVHRTTPLFGWLFAALAIAFVVPASSLLRLGTGGQWLLGGLMVALPVFFAALIFSTLLSRRADGTRALAYNLLGAIVGGVLEYSSMVIGIKGLYVVAAVLYLLAFVVSSTRITRETP